MAGNGKNRIYHVAYDGPTIRGTMQGDCRYVTGPEGMTAEDLQEIKRNVIETQGFNTVRISFFAELAI